MSFIQRLNIAIDVANALDYLHNHCETPIVHCDLKPSNVLLDDDMVAHVGDFGLARFIFEGSDQSSYKQTMSMALKGSIGYIPPGIFLPFKLYNLCIADIRSLFSLCKMMSE